MKKKAVDNIRKKPILSSSMEHQATADGRTYSVLPNERGVRLNEGPCGPQKIVKNHGSRPIQELSKGEIGDFVSRHVGKVSLKPAKLS